MRKWLLALFLVSLGGLVAVHDAEARRLGGGRSIGAQRSVTAPPAKPAPQQAAPQQGQNPPATPQAGSRWGGILGGLALGGLLGYLFGGSGFMGILALALLAFLAVAVIGALARRPREGAQRPVQLAGMGDETVPAPPPSQAGAFGAALSPTALPPGFDTAGFLRAAKSNFIKLQIANDAGRLDEIREFTTHEMFDALRADAPPGHPAAHSTDVVALNADLLELATENDRHWASVRFSGMVRETPGTEPVGFAEVWNLVKPVDGSSGWLLAGIQQMH
jgi:predicted lipid-binding transport protein (Tim44 family)